MREYIKKLQAKDEGARKRILYAYMTASMLVVAFVWIYSLGYRFNTREEEVAKTENEIKPLALFRDSLVSTYKNITASVGNIPTVSKLMNETNKEEIPGKQIDLIIVE